MKKLVIIVALVATITGAVAGIAKTGSKPVNAIETAPKVAGTIEPDPWGTKSIGLEKA